MSQCVKFVFEGRYILYNFGPRLECPVTGREARELRLSKKEKGCKVIAGQRPRLKNECKLYGIDKNFASINFFYNLVLWTWDLDLDPY